MSVRVTPHLNRRLSLYIACLLCLSYSSIALSGYKNFLDPRSMAMGGTGVAAATKFNASSHNPALIAFNRGDKPDKIYISSSLGTRELYNENLNKDILELQDSNLADFYTDFVEAAEGGDLTRAREEAAKIIPLLKEKEYSSYRSDEMDAFSLLVDTDPVTIDIFSRREIREMTIIINSDEDTINQAIQSVEQDDDPTISNQRLSSSVNSTYFDFREVGATVATTNVIDYNMPISWGFTPKLIQYNASHVSSPIFDEDDAYDVNNPDAEVPSESNLEWNLDVGFAMLFTDDFLREEFGLDGWWLEGEWVFAFSGMNLFPTDISNFSPSRFSSNFPGDKASVQALYQVGIAHYREKYMLTMDIELTEDKVYERFEGNSRFLSFGGEYYWRDDFHLRGGLRINTSQTELGAKESTSLHAGFMYQPHGLSIEAAAMISEYEVGGSVGFGLAF